MDYTNRKERGGIQPKEIHKITKIISLRTIQEHLSVLLRERKVEKRKDKGHKKNIVRLIVIRLAS